MSAHRRLILCHLSADVVGDVAATVDAESSPREASRARRRSRACSRSRSRRSTTACCRAISPRIVSRSPTASSPSPLHLAHWWQRSHYRPGCSERRPHSAPREASRSSRKKRFHHLAQALRSPSRVGSRPLGDDARVMASSLSTAPHLGLDQARKPGGPLARAPRRLDRASHL